MDRNENTNEQRLTPETNSAKTGAKSLHPEQENGFPVRTDEIGVQNIINSRVDTAASPEINAPVEAPFEGTGDRQWASISNGAGRTDVRFAGFWMRFWAYLLDLIVVGSIFRLIAKPVFIFLDIESSGGLFSPDAIVSAVIFYVYFVLMTKFFHQTLGKMVFGLSVIDIKDGSLSWMDVLIREWIGRFISSWLLILYLIPAFHPKKQALHDIFADTAVIHTEG